MFTGRIYNEFNTWIRWEDFLSITIFNFPIIMFRRYDFLEVEFSSYNLIILGFDILPVKSKWRI